MSVASVVSYSAVNRTGQDTYSFANPSEGNLILIAISDQGTTVTGVTYGGVAATLLVKNDPDWPMVYMYGIKGEDQPTPGASHDLVISGGTNTAAIISFIKIKNAVQNFSEYITNAASQNSSSFINLGITTPANDYLIVDAVVFRDATATSVAAGQTRMTFAVFNSPRSGGTSYKLHESAGSTIMRWDRTSGGTNRIRLVAVAIPTAEPVAIIYKASGYRITGPINIEDWTQNAVINWTGATPAGTAITIKTGVNESNIMPPETWETEANGEPITSLSTDNTGKYLWVRQELATTDEMLTPTLESLSVDYEYRTGQEVFGTQMATGVSRCVMLRGWKSDKNPTNDEGLILAYLKTDGQIYYRNRCEQPNGTLVWEDERLVSDLPSNCAEVALFRTNDYRVGFVVQTSTGNVHWAITARTWAGFGIDETIKVSMQNFSIDYIPITYLYGYTAETIAVQMENFETALCPFMVIDVQNIANPGQSETDIIITFDRNISGIVDMPADFETAFSIVDESMNPVTVTGVAYEGTNAIKLTCNNFGGASGDLTINYTKVPGVIGAYSKDMSGAANPFTCWFDMENFVEIFTPDLEPPTGYTSETIAVSMQNFNVDFIKITEYEAYHEEKIAVSMQNFTVDLIHVNDIEV